MLIVFKADSHRFAPQFISHDAGRSRRQRIPAMVPTTNHEGNLRACLLGKNRKSARCVMGTPLQVLGKDSAMRARPATSLSLCAGKYNVWLVA
jgi:hypothetical protein